MNIDDFDFEINRFVYFEQFVGVVDDVHGKDCRANGQQFATVEVNGRLYLPITILIHNISYNSQYYKFHDNIGYLYS